MMSELSGSFGSNENRGKGKNHNNGNFSGETKRDKIHFEGNRFTDFIRSISPENWIDIVCCSLILIFLIVVICTWSSFSAALFQNVLFPIIYIGSRIVAFVGIAIAAIGALALTIRRKLRRFWCCE